jgi:choice-of-anchor C domain-containing protein
LFGSGEAQAHGFINGSFEQASIYGSVYQAHSTYITGWVVGGYGVDYIGAPTEHNYWVGSDGKASIQLVDNAATAPGAMTQTFDTVTGATYTVLFDLAGNPGFPGYPQGVTSIVRASAGNDHEDYTFNTKGKSFAHMGWVTEAFTFTALSGSSTLALTDIYTGSGILPVIDNVRVSEAAPPTPVPEPSTWVMLAW